METLDIKTVVRNHLASKGVTLWANWDISRPEGLDAATDWLADEMMTIVRALQPDAFVGFPSDDG